MSGPTFNAGRDIKGAFATAPDATATATWSENSEAIIAELQGLRRELSLLPDLDPRVAERLGAAEAEASKPEHRKAIVETLVQDAVRCANDASGFADATEKLLPHLHRIGAWLGHSWPAWSSALGLG